VLSGGEGFQLPSPVAPGIDHDPATAIRDLEAGVASVTAAAGLDLAPRSEKDELHGRVAGRRSPACRSELFEDSRERDARDIQ